MANEAELRALLGRCLPIVEHDALFQDSIIRHMPLPPDEQADFEAKAGSEQLADDIRAALAARPPMTDEGKVIVTEVKGAKRGK